LMDKERARNGRIYQDWDDVVQPTQKATHKRRSTNYSCPPQMDTAVVSVPQMATGVEKGIDVWDHPAH
nr:hypothetical protein [Tanacetum cinerariifolium]